MAIDATGAANATRQLAEISFRRIAWQTQTVTVARSMEREHGHAHGAALRDAIYDAIHADVPILNYMQALVDNLLAPNPANAGAAVRNIVQRAAELAVQQLESRHGRSLYLGVAVRVADIVHNNGAVVGAVNAFITALSPLVPSSAAFAVGQAMSIGAGLACAVLEDIRGHGGHGGSLGAAIGSAATSEPLFIAQRDALQAALTGS